MENTKKVNQKELIELRQELNALKSLVRGQSSSSSSNMHPSCRGSRPRRSDTCNTRDAPQHKYEHPYYATKPLQGSFVPWGASSASIFTPGQSCKYRTNQQKFISNASTTSSSFNAQASSSKCGNDKEERPIKRPKTVNAVDEGSSMKFSEGDILVAAVHDAGDTTNEGESESSFTIAQPLLEHTYNQKGKQPAIVAAASMQDNTDDKANNHAPEAKDEQDREAQTSLPVSIKPLKVLIWECKITDATTSEFLVTVNALINSGAVLVLISEKVVSCLGLQRHPLPRPMSITTATLAIPRTMNT
ncbi:hypothetical protein NP233_g59 [Leucocoprinus birnbaumii]|uniref:Uncharacterized protein n=1 Tax=Leucocoprinus birnbaumii TaxID=56174 RepID=A0AAD5YX17_9AGAR|nr:hypothetical protein NP233_g59 [Leucocoprinus birnbaumii]